MTGDITTVRSDLVAGYRLLETLGKLITVEDFSEASTGARVVVAAPHQAPSGTPLSRGHDVHTGIVAERLARALQGKCVVAHELRTFVDLNKDPSGARQETSVRHLGRLAFREADRRLKLYYQSQIFSSNPGTVIEVHGHARGVFDLEISTGFQLDERVEQDRVLIAALKSFEATLVQALSASPVFEGEPPTVGVYPLNPAVRFTAKGTHTFNKIEKLRELGVNTAGLHIELRKTLRPDPAHGDSETIYQELIHCLTVAVQAFVKSSEGTVAFDFKERLLGDLSSDEEEGVAALAGCAFKLCPVPKDLVGLQVATLCQRDMKKLGLEEGHPVLVGADPGFRSHVELQAATASTLRAGCLGMAKKFRDELGLEPGDDVFLGRRSATAGDGLTLGYVSFIDDGGAMGSVEVGRFLAERLESQTSAGASLTLNSSSGEGHDVSILETDSLPHDRAIALSTALAGELSVTFGDLVYFASAG